MDGVEPRHDEGGVMGVPEIDDGDQLLVELLDASLAGAAEEPEVAAAAGDGQQLGFTAGVLVSGDDDGWDGKDELSYTIHPHHDCEDCGLDGMLSDLEGCGRAVLSPAPYVVDIDGDGTLEWTETEGMGEWYMDGMAMEWEEEEEYGGSWCSFGPYYGAEAGTEQVYGSPLWE
ncbi:hypothetical protein ACP4OV_025041 [Aristida adscensionis]